MTIGPVPGPEEPEEGTAEGEQEEQREFEEEAIEWVDDFARVPL